MKNIGFSEEYSFSDELYLSQSDENANIISNNSTELKDYRNKIFLEIEIY